MAFFSRLWSLLDINSATLSGSIDVIVVRRPDGTLKASPFHVRFGKLQLLRATSVAVNIRVNGVLKNVSMEVGEAGAAFFVEDDTDSEDGDFSDSDSFSIPSDEEGSAGSAVSLPDLASLQDMDDGLLQWEWGHVPARTKGRRPTTRAVHRLRRLRLEPLSLRKLGRSNSLGRLDHDLDRDRVAAFCASDTDGDDVGDDDVDDTEVVEEEAPADAAAAAQARHTAVARGSDVEIEVEDQAGATDPVQVPQQESAAGGATKAASILSKPPMRKSSVPTSHRQRRSSTHSNRSRINSVGSDHYRARSTGEEERRSVTTPSPNPATPASPSRETKKKKGWFGWLRRGGSSANADQDDSSDNNNGNSSSNADTDNSKNDSRTTKQKQHAGGSPSSDTVAVAPHVAAQIEAERKKQQQEQKEQHGSPLVDADGDVLEVRGVVSEESIKTASGHTTPDHPPGSPPHSTTATTATATATASEPVAMQPGRGTHSTVDEQAGGTDSYPDELPPSSPGGGRGWIFGWWRRDSAREDPADKDAVQGGNTSARSDVTSQDVLSNQAEVGSNPGTKTAAAGDQADVTGLLRRGKKHRIYATEAELEALDLHDGCNEITFSVWSGYRGTQSVTSYVWVWPEDAKIVVSDIDGTITKSDVLGQVVPVIGRDWSHPGVASFLSHIKSNGYRVMYLTSRAIGQSTQTRNYLNSVKQGPKGTMLPKGPVIMSPDRLFESFKREVIRRLPQEFKIAALQSIAALFSPGSRPFFAGFGNRHTDFISYRAVDMPPSKIFVINPDSEVKQAHHNKFISTSYEQMDSIVDSFFPPINDEEDAKSPTTPNAPTLEEYNSFNFWKAPMPHTAIELDIEQQ